MDIDPEALKIRVFEIIKVADLDTCTAKSVRKLLEAELKADLETYKDKINDLISLAIEDRIKEESATQRTQSTLDSNDQVEKSLEREDEIDDETLAKQLQEAENSKGLRSRRSSTRLPRVKGKRLTRKEAGTSRSAPRNGFNQPYVLSEPLSRLVGATEMSRPQVVKHIWAYVKENNLQDPADRRILVCDELLLAVMKKPKISCFGMNKILSDHLIKPEDLAGGAKKRPVDEVDSDEE